MLPFRFASIVVVCTALAPVIAIAQSPSPHAAHTSELASLASREAHYWERTPLAIPSDIVLEVSGILPVTGKRLLVTTRRGEIWWIDGAYDPGAKPRFTLFASGLHEPMGIVPAPQGGYYIAQRQELTRIADEDGDGRADLFQTVSKLAIRGSYHEYAFGPVLAPNGNVRITLNVAFGGSPLQGAVPWRGWMLEITPDGQIIPIAAGLRSPTSMLLTKSGDWFYSENQGEWVGSGRVTHVEPGDFTGHPAGLSWSRLPGSPVQLRVEDIRDFKEPMPEVAKKLPGLKLPAVWFPHAILGISTTDMAEDVTGGKFGPFAGQFFVGDQGHSKIMRMSLEKVKGVWQGAAYSFREGFEAGIVRLAFGEGGVLFAGQTDRGWSSMGTEEQGLERVTWTGRVPFDIREVRAQPDGFLLTFTQPVDRVTAGNPAHYLVNGFTYLYHEAYGSPPVSQMGCPVQKVVVAEDGLSVRLGVACLREGYIHQIKAAGVRSADKREPLLHHEAYYTLNRLPDGTRILPDTPVAPELCVTPIAPLASGHTRKHPIRPPENWGSGTEDTTIVVGTEPGLKFDQTLITAKAGARVRLVLRNSDDMLHNLVLCAPGRGAKVGEAAMLLGMDGMAKHFVPSGEDVLYHTALVAPGDSDTLYFTAPSEPGDYDYICSFPGHATLMKGIFRVEAR